MARTNELPRVLWLVTSTWLVGCGRLGFGSLQDDPAPPLPDGPVTIPDATAPIVDASPVPDTVPIDGPAVSPVDGSIDGSVDGSIAVGTPAISFVIPPITTTCGAGTTTVPATVKNPGTAELRIDNITLMAGDAFQIAATFPIIVAPGKTATFQITALAAVLGTDRGGQVKSDNLLVTANTPTAPAPMAISTTIMGANIDVTDPVPPLLRFSSSVSCPLGQSATITNSGNLPATVKVVVPGSFAMNGATSASVAINGVMTRTFRPVTSSECSGAGVIDYQVTGTTCNLDATVDVTFNITGTSSCFCS